MPYAEPLPEDRLLANPERAGPFTSRYRSPMLMQTEYLLAFALIFTLDSISPGPAVATVIAKGSTIGLARTMPFIAGLVLGDLALFVLAVAGLVALAAALGPLFTVVKWIGIAYLLWLAWRLWHATPVEVSGASVAGEGWRLFGVGCLMPFGNPKRRSASTSPCCRR